MSCQYYDRKHAKATSGGAPQWGQCRRSAPRLNPVNAKSYMIEGIWPTVRDDDWCGEWKLLARRVDSRVAEALNAPLIAAQSLSASSPRVAALTTVPPKVGNGAPGASPVVASITAAVAQATAAMARPGSD
jgi:hypothetical protein